MSATWDACLLRGMHVCKPKKPFLENSLSMVSIKVILTSVHLIQTLQHLL